MLPALPWCTCCRHYPGAATGCLLRSHSPALSAFPGLGAGSACASSFSRLARRSLALRPAHSRCHQFVTRFTRGLNHFVTSIVAPVASGWSGCRVGLSPTGKAPPLHGARQEPVIPRRPSGHATTKSLWLKRMGRLFEKQRQGWQFQALDQLRSERHSEMMVVAIETEPTQQVGTPGLLFEGSYARPLFSLFPR